VDEGLTGFLLENAESVVNNIRIAGNCLRGADAAVQTKNLEPNRV
jgi:hypothetical protein